jgi:hypothetical protein
MFQLKPEWFDKMQPRPNRNTGTPNRTGVFRNFRLIKHNMKQVNS